MYRVKYEEEREKIDRDEIFFQGYGALESKMQVFK